MDHSYRLARMALDAHPRVHPVIGWSIYIAWFCFRLFMGHPDSVTGRALGAHVNGREYGHKSKQVTRPAMGNGTTYITETIPSAEQRRLNREKARRQS